MAGGISSAGGYLELGRPLAVDLVSLNPKAGPVRVRYACRTPVALQSHITLFVNLKGFKVHVEHEVGGTGKGPAPPSPPTSKKRDKDDNDKDYNRDLSSDEEVSKDRNPKKARKSKSKYPTSKSGKGGHNHTTQGSCCGASQGSAHCDCSVWFIPSDDGRELKGDGRGGTEETGAGYLYVIG